MIKGCITVIIWLYVCVGIIAAVVPGEPNSLNLDIARLAKAGSPIELALCINTILSQVPARTLDSIVGDEDCTVALAAGWERVRRTVPKETQRRPVPPNKQSLSRFSGLLEERMRVAIPRVWGDALQTASSYGRHNIWFPQPKILNKLTTSSATCASVAMLRREGDRWLVTQGNETWSVLAEDRLGIVEQAVVELTDEKAYLCLYGWPPLPYRLYSINRKSGKVAWSSLVWAAGGLLTYDGQGWHQVELVGTSDKIIVYGMSENTAYVEVFDCITGHNMGRFSTSYFDMDRAKLDK